jgi:lipopolysaccharide transport system permease protein
VSASALPPDGALDVTLAPPREPVLRPARAQTVRPRVFVALVVHLTVRHVRSSHHLTLLGWAWPVTRLLAQLTVLVFLFSKVIQLDIPNYPIFVFIGLLAWNWFSSGVSAAAMSVLTQRHLVMQPRLPRSVLPIVAVSVPLVDVLFSLPVLILMLALTTGLRWGLLACPLLFALQFVLVAGIGWLVAGVSVFLRDVPNLVGVALMILFYLTPVFYAGSRVPEHLRWVLDLNPLTTIFEAYRSLMLGTPGPGLARLGAVAAASVVAALLGHRVFTRLAPRFADHL